MTQLASRPDRAGGIRALFGHLDRPGRRRPHVRAPRPVLTRVLDRPHSGRPAVPRHAGLRLLADGQHRAGLARVLARRSRAGDLVHPATRIPRRVPVLPGVRAGATSARCAAVAGVPSRVVPRVRRHPRLAAGASGLEARTHPRAVLRDRAAARQRLPAVRCLTGPQPRPVPRRRRAADPHQGRAWSGRCLVRRAGRVAEGSLGRRDDGGDRAGERPHRPRRLGRLDPAPRRVRR